jgi:cathepsin L
MILSLLSAAKAIPLPSESNSELDDHWETFKTTYGKRYDSHSESLRRLIWESNLEFIQRHNMEYDLGKHSYSLGINEFADLTQEEFQQSFLSSNMDLDDDDANDATSSNFMTPLNVKSYPTSVDWRTEGYVTEVKQQGTCGSCWSFAANGALEGQFFRKTGKLLDFSEQQLVDCSSKYHNHGCQSGQMNRAYNYIKDFGIESDEDYPYIAEVGQCNYTRSKVVTKISGHANVRRFSEKKLLESVATVGPISVAMDGSQPTFRFYKNGVYDEESCSPWSLNHGMLVVGYGTEAGKAHWIVKNSWGTSWGEKGFILMSRNKGNQCGIATLASYPTL